MTSEELAFWGAVIVPAVASFFLNWIVRGHNAFKSSGADWLLVILAFDVTGIFTTDDFARHVQHPDFKESLNIIFTFGLLVSICLWMFVVLRLEPIFNGTAKNGFSKVKRIFAYAAVWAVVISLFSAHIAIFTLKETFQ